MTDLDSEINSLISKYKSLSIVSDYDDWHKLHKWAKTYRKVNKLTIREFLRLFGIEDSSSNVQYLSGDGKDRRVSKKEGTKGKALIDALEMARKAAFSTNVPVAATISLEKAIEIFEDLSAELFDLGIEGVSCKSYDDTTNTIVIKVMGNEVRRTDKSENSILGDLKSLINDYLDVNIDISEVTWFVECGYLSPLCIDVNSTVGTATIIDIKGKSVAITAKHILKNVGESSEVNVLLENGYNPERICKLSRKSSFGLTLDQLWHGNRNVDVGLAIILESQYNLYDNNILRGLGSFRFPVDLQSFQADVKLHTQSYKLIKSGISTGTTVGTIAELDSDMNAWISGTEFGPVAFHGDSGSLWIVLKCNSNMYEGVVFGITSMIAVKDKNNLAILEVKVIPVWLWMDWLFDDDLLVEDLDT